MTNRTTTVIPAAAVVAFLGLLLLASGAEAAGGVSIHGYVLDRDSRIVANASVLLLENEAPLPTSSNPALTDTNGYYSFWGIGRGTYCLVASKGAYSMSNTILIQDRDAMINFTLQATASELADRPLPTATPSPTPAPTPSPTAAPPATATPVPASAPGFRLALFLPGAAAAILLLLHPGAGRKAR